MAEKIKSDLQQMLETQGWEYLTNVSTTHDVEQVPNLDFIYLSRSSPKSDFEIAAEFLSHPVFQDVKITDAYNLNGEFIPGMKAVYVIRKSA